MSAGEIKCFDSFQPIVRDWFLEEIGEPSDPQILGWPTIAAGKNVLVCAPTGSGKTLTAFFKCLDHVYATKDRAAKNGGIRILYISPLKALNNDIYRNLERPLQGIAQKSEERGIALPEIAVAIRTGDTPQKERARILKSPPDILITTPESLFIMLTSKAAEQLFTTVEYIIVDEIHSICSNKRGVHLSVSLERVEKLAGGPVKRIGLSATISPLEEIARYLGGYRNLGVEQGGACLKEREVTVVNCDRKRKLDLCINVPVRDLRSLPENSVWPNIYSQLLVLVRAHRSTLIFVNNRRVAELVAVGINNLAGEDLVKTHHGSISREVRQQIEKQLKDGELPCLVATSTLELGIDIGHIELVIQVGAPGSAAQTLQRIGRSGHSIHHTSKGCIIPKTRSDLLDAAFISAETRQFHIEDIRVPENCLDILAQHITSMVCCREYDAADIYDTVRGAYPYRNLPYKKFEDLLNMLADPSPVYEPGSIKPRLVFDRIAGKVRGNSLGRMMCLLDGGTIPDKGNYTVYLKDTNTRLGELEEEFVFESRLGDRFFLGSSVWRLDAVEHDRVIVTPSEASGAKIPFWMGDRTLRPYETGRRYGQFLREAEAHLESGDFIHWAGAACGLDRTAAENLQQYVAEQKATTGYLCSDRLIVCEYFSDEVGERRVIIHSPFGGKVHAALAIILQSRLAKLLDCSVEYVYNDSGILLHIFGYSGTLGNLFSLVTGGGMEEEILQRLPDSPLFNLNLRYNLTRSLLLNSRRYGKRRPLWVQRLRSAEILQHIQRTHDHPVITETFRECLRDILDLDSLYKVVAAIKNGSVQVAEVVTSRPSPFSTELLFNFWQIYQYAYDLPVAERRNQLLVTDREFIHLAVGTAGEYELMDPRAVKHVEKELMKNKYGRKIRTADELYYLIYSLGEYEAEPYNCIKIKGTEEEDCLAFLRSLEEQGRILRLPIGEKGQYWIASEDYPLYCKIAGADPASRRIWVGEPGREREVAAGEWINSFILSMDPAEEEAALRIIRRHILFHGPFQAGDLEKRYRMPGNLLKDILELLERKGEILRLKDAHSLAGIVFCQSKVYDRIKRKTVELARKDIKPKSPEVYCSFLLAYQGVGGTVVSDEEQMENIVKKLQGLFLPAAWWEDFIFPSRLPAYDPRLLDYLCATGVIKWIARTVKNTREIAFFQEEDFLSYIPSGTDAPEPEGAEGDILRFLQEKGACFLKDLVKYTKDSPQNLLGKVESLVWNGWVVNDSYNIIRYYLENEKKNSPWVKYNTYPNLGRWSAAEAGDRRKGAELLDAYINRLLDRYGLISKEIVACEKWIFNWGDIYSWLKARELSSGIKRGLYVEGLSGIQFARDAEIEKLRMLDTPERKEEYAALCACDPANPYKDLWSGKLTVKITKAPSAALILKNGLPVLAAREYGGWLLPLSEDGETVGKAIGSFLKAFSNKNLWAGRKNIFTEHWGEDRLPVEECSAYDLLQSMGYDREYRGMSFWRKSV